MCDKNASVVFHLLTSAKDIFVANTILKILKPLYEYVTNTIFDDKSNLGKKRENVYKLVEVLMAMKCLARSRA